MNTTWIESAGGPLICAEQATGLLWCGVRASSIGEQRSDYDRACDVSDYLAVVPCASSQVLVFGDEPLRTALIGVAARVAIVRWVSCASASAAQMALGGIPAALPQLEGPRAILLKSSQLVLFDAACPFDEAPDLLEFEVEPGLYEVSTEKYANPGVFEFLIHRMTKASGSSR